eukprot:6903914-Ditylum_brightwellii.AAC.1
MSSSNNSGSYKKSPILENNYKEPKQCIEESQKKYEEMLQSINAKLERKENDQKSSIQSLVKELLQEELEKIIPDIVHTILSQTKERVNNIIKGIQVIKTRSTYGNMEDTVSVVTNIASKVESHNFTD